MANIPAPGCSQYLPMNTLNTALLRRSLNSWISSDIPRVGPYWLQLFWTGLLSLAFAIAFTVLALAIKTGDANLPGADRLLKVFGQNLVISATVSYMIHAFFEVGGRLIGGEAGSERMRAWQRVLYFGGLPMLGVILGWPLGLYLSGVGGLETFTGDQGRRIIVLSLSLALLLTTLSYFWFGARARALMAERQATEAQLRLLQAQIEPHFLFNTLANVQSLMDHDPPKARQMLQSFTDYLRVSLGALRRDEGPLSQELELARIYLSLQQARMEDRLRFTVQADEAAEQQMLPPLLLQPLVENAVHHGLEPSIEGGTLQVRAMVQNKHLVLEVLDDGRGLNAAPRPGPKRGNGVALDNVRQRLQARYGDAAKLELLGTQAGTCARITLPVQPTR